MIKHINDLKTWLETKIIGQESLVERLIIALLSDGHVLVEGAPGLAKTKAIKTLSEAGFPLKQRRMPLKVNCWENLEATELK